MQGFIMQVSIDIKDDLYKRLFENGVDLQAKFNEYLVTILEKKKSYLDSKQFQEDQAYFHEALKEIENGNGGLLTQTEYDKEMNEFMKAL